MDIFERFEQIQSEYYGEYYTAKRIPMFFAYAFKTIKLILLEGTWKQKLFFLGRFLAAILDHGLLFLALVSVLLYTAYMLITMFMWIMPILKLIPHYPAQFNDWIISVVPQGMKPSGDFWVGLARFIAWWAMLLPIVLMGAVHTMYDSCSTNGYDKYTTMKERIICCLLRIILLSVYCAVFLGLLYLVCFVMTPETWKSYTIHIIGIFIVAIVIMGLVSSENEGSSSMASDCGPVQPSGDDGCDAQEWDE